MTSKETERLIEGATTERSLLSLANRLNPELTERLLKQGASVEQILMSVEAVMSCAPPPQQNVVQFQQPQPQNPFSFDQPGGPMASSVSGFGRAFDVEFEQGRLMAQSLKDRGYGPTAAGMRSIA